MKFLLPGTLLLALLLSSPARAGEMEMVEVEVLFLKATEKQWAAALDGLPHSPAQPAANAPGRMLMVNGAFSAPQTALLLPKMKDSGAEVATRQKMVTVSGRQLSVKNVRELRYPTEFAPAKDGSEGVYPIAFETKDVGVSLELTPTVGPDGYTIDLFFTPRIVDFRGFIDAGQFKADTDTRDPATIKKLLRAPLKKGSPWQPVFDTREVTTEVTIYDGGSVLLVESPAPGEPDTALTGILVTARLAPKK